MLKKPIKSQNYIKILEDKIPKNFFETLSWSQSRFVCGFDEAGRGCLAGPVVAAAVVLPVGADFLLLKDSKKLSEKQRLDAFSWIKQNCWYSFAMSDAWIIDKVNILEATKLAMQKAFLQLLASFEPGVKKLGCAVIDAVKVDLRQCHANIVEDFKMFNPCKAEDISSSVAAASIVAKVMRDSIVTESSQFFKGYNFAQHKGYGTQAHIDKILSYGASILHRTKFVGTALNTLEQKNV